MTPSTAPRLLSEADATRLLRDADPAAPCARISQALDGRAASDLIAIFETPEPSISSTRHHLPAPTRRNWARPMLFAGVPAAATAAVAVAVVISSMQPRGDELASWSPVPATAPGSHVSDDAIEEWATQCRDLTDATISISGVPAHREQAAGRDVLVDRRGIYTFCLDYSQGSATETDPMVTVAGIKGGDVQQTWGTVYDRPFTTPTGGDVLVLGGDSTTVVPTDEDGHSTVEDGVLAAYGLAGAGVTGVDVVLTNGLRVTATIEHGTWAAWWPATKGSTTGAMLTIHTTTGQHTVAPGTAGLDWDR